MDKLLQWIVDNVEKGELEEGLITVAVPGGIFSGELIPTWRFVQMMGNALQGDGQTRPNGSHSPAQGSSDVPKVPVEESEYLHLLSPTVLSSMDSSNEPMVIPAIRIRVDSISAWTSGGIRGD